MYVVSMQAERQAVLDRLFEIAARLGDVMAATLSQHGLTPARAEALLVLHYMDGPVVQRQLADTLRCTPRHVTALADALETGGWVIRQPHPTDRRATLISLTTKGKSAVAWIEAQRQSAADRLLAGIPARDLAGFLTVTDHVLLHIDAEQPPPPPQ
jgi:DNA-binding MarR family transcriptional regulator